MNKELTRREFLRLSGAAGTTLVAGSSLLGCGDADPNSQQIVRYAVHPAIGIARVGNSSSEFFLAPEVPGETPEPVGGFKDGTGAIKRQAARFRVYGYNAAGIPVREITADEAEIEWSVHVANRKAAWYDFDTAMDIPEAGDAGRRNKEYRGTSRDALAVDPGSRTVSGRNSPAAVFDGGTFLGDEIYLGEISTDEQGRLVFLGGYGSTYHPSGASLTTFANNEGWCDDISDGPVRATVRVGGESFEADPAWVASTPPNFGPSIRAGFVSMYDVVENVMVDRGWLAAGQVSFAAHILPLFLRLADMQWVNKGVLDSYGFGSPEPLEDPGFLLRLADPSPENEAFRTEWFERFRNPDYLEMEPDRLPPMYGDAIVLPAKYPRNWLAPTELQYERLEQWARGEAKQDLDLDAWVPEVLSDLPGSEQPAALDRAALEPVLGGAFHPGTELTWILRMPQIFGDLFRLNATPPGVPTNQNFGEVLTPSRAVSLDGPLAVSGPGDITKWMATPWQTDTVSCRNGYNREVSIYLPTFWPARAPNEVLTEGEYAILMDGSASDQLKELAFSLRSRWLRHILRTDKTATLERMVANWPKLGIVTERPGPNDGIAPARLKVEVDSGFGEEDEIVPVDMEDWAAPILSRRG